MNSNILDGPDFICIGMPKAGTGWLFDQLKYHPDFWIPPVKELSYLSRRVPRIKSAQKRIDAVSRPGRERKFGRWANRRPDDERDFAFLREVNDSIGRSMDLEFYASLFRYKEDAISGDISSGYCLTDADVVSRLEQRFPLTKILVLVRDPVARAWSHICMWHRAGTFDDGLLKDASAFRNFLKSSGKLRRTSFPSRIVVHWRENAPKLTFRYFFFDDIVENPSAARNEMLLYLGADPERCSGNIDAGHNKKAQNKKLMLDDRTRGVLIDYFGDELRTCAELFGDRGKTWAARYVP